MDSLPSESFTDQARKWVAFQYSTAELSGAARHRKTPYPLPKQPGVMLNTRFCIPNVSTIPLASYLGSSHPRASKSCAQGGRGILSLAAQPRGALKCFMNAMGFITFKHNVALFKRKREIDMGSLDLGWMQPIKRLHSRVECSCKCVEAGVPWRSPHPPTTSPPEALISRG